MSSTRAFLATLGTSLSLIAGGTLALFAVSAFVAFHGWPDIGDGGRVNAPGLVVRAPDDGAPPADAVPADATLLLGTRAAAPVATRGGVRGARERSAPATTSPAPGAPGSATPHPGVIATPGTGDGTTVPTTVATGAPKSGDIVRDAGKALSQATGTLTGAASQSLIPVAPAAGTAVQQIGASASDAVDAVTQSVAGVVDDVLPARK